MAVCSPAGLLQDRMCSGFCASSSQSRTLAPSASRQTRLLVSPSAPLQRHRLQSVQRVQHLAVRAEKREGELLQGYTPANYISYTSSPEHRCHHMAAIEVLAPASSCFQLWSEWARLVDFLDLIAQIGLDPDEPDMALIQAFYRWGRMPVMEIVFLAQKTHQEQDKLIQYETVWGMPAQAEVSFIDNGNSTTVIFKLEHQLPWILVDMKIGAMGVHNSLRGIFAENMSQFKTLVESMDPPPPPSKKGSRPAEQQQQQQEQPQDQQYTSSQSQSAQPPVQQQRRKARSSGSRSESPPVDATADGGNQTSRRRGGSSSSSTGSKGQGEQRQSGNEGTQEANSSPEAGSEDRAKAGGQGITPGKAISALKQTIRGSKSPGEDGERGRQGGGRKMDERASSKSQAAR